MTNLFTPLWLGWFGLFVLIEGTALWAQSSGRLKGNGTLSALVWRFIAHPVPRVLFMVGWVVLTSHLIWKFP